MPPGERTPLVVGNRVVLLQDGPAAYQAMFAAIAAARDHINMETYIFADDEVGAKFAAALAAKQAQGVQVSLIYDSVGSIDAPDASARARKRWTASFAARGGTGQITSPPTRRPSRLVARSRRPGQR